MTSVPVPARERRIRDNGVLPPIRGSGRSAPPSAKSSCVSSMTTVRAQSPHHLHLRRAAHAGNLSAKGLGELDGDAPHHARGTHDQHLLARLHLPVVAKGLKCGEATVRHDGCLLELQECWLAVASRSSRAHAYSAKAPLQVPYTSSPGWRNRVTALPTLSTHPATLDPGAGAFGARSPVPTAHDVHGTPVMRYPHPDPHRAATGTGSSTAWSATSGQLNLPEPQNVGGSVSILHDCLHRGLLSRDSASTSSTHLRMNIPGHTGQPARTSSPPPPATAGSEARRRRRKRCLTQH